MTIITSTILNKFPEIIFGFSTKKGAGRKAPYFFNLSFSVGDNNTIVEENRKLFFEHLGLDEKNVVTQKQIHSGIVRYTDRFEGIKESDALITRKKNLGLAVTAADCTAVFLYDQKEKIIAAVHSGWRGTYKQILSETLNKLSVLGSKPEDLVVYIGPSIKQRNYEVGREVADLFQGKYVLKKNGKYFLDIPGVNYDILAAFGVREDQIEVSPLCTYESVELLHSYRRDGVSSGRSIGVIALKGDE